MRILIVTFDEPFFLPSFFATILKAHAKDVIGCITHPYRNGQVKGIKELTKTHSIFELMKLFFHFLKISSLYYLTGHPLMSVKQVMKSYNIPVHDIPRLNSELGKNLLNKLKPDIILSQTSEIVPQALLEIPKFGWFNKHASLLPKYRGLNPLFWALYNNESKVGVTIYKMTKVLDHGPILAQETIPVPPRVSLFELYSQVFLKGAKLVNAVLQNPTHVMNNPEINNDAFKTPSKEQIAKFRRNGFSFV